MIPGCYLCGAVHAELRPYGPRGENVCFPCAFTTDEQKATTERMFAATLDAAGPVAVLTEHGPVPMDGGEQ